MEYVENNDTLLLLKTGSSLKSLIAFSELLQEENERLKKELQNVQTSKQCEVEALSKKYSDLLKKNKDLEWESNSSVTHHEQKVHELENDKLYLQHELVALQHLCELKEKELSSLKAQSSADRPITTPIPSPDLPEQVTYIDNKLQKVLNHVYEVRAECERAESKLTESTHYIQTLTQNIHFLYGILIEAISLIVLLQTENTHVSTAITAIPSQPIEVHKDEEEVVVREYSLSSLEYQFTSFETQVKALQELIEQQKKDIESLRCQKERIPETNTNTLSFTSFDEISSLLRENLNERIRLLEEENTLLKTQVRQALKNGERPVNNNHGIQDPTIPNGYEKEERCRKCNEHAYGFMISCCKCNACFHVSCVISKKESISDLLKKKKQFVCGLCKK